MKVFKKYPLTMFFILAFLFPWIVWGTSIAETRGVLPFHIPQPLAFWVGLTLATYLTAALTGGMPAVRDLLLRLIRWRVHPAWYVVAAVLTGILSFVSIGVYLAFGGSHQFDAITSPVGLLLSFLFQVFFFLLTEETAWRGFALPRLQARYSALTSSLILGLIWGLWHAPLVFIPGSFQATVPFVGFVLSAIATAILATWIFNHSHGSVLVAALFHGATDVSIASSSVMAGERRLFWIFVAVQWIAAVIIIALQGPSHLSRSPNLAGTTYPEKHR